MKRPGPATLSQVADLAGVSLATASRVLNGGGRTVGEPYRSKVVGAAEALGYRPNAHAQSIVSGASNLVGLVLHDIADPYFSAIASGVIAEAELRGLVVMLGTTKRDPEREMQFVSMLRSQRATAIIVAGSRTTHRDQTERLVKEIRGFVAGGGRVAAVSQNKLGTHTVLPLNRAGARELGLALVGLGHRRFVLMGGPRDLLTARDRLAGVQEALRASGIDAADVSVHHGPFTRDGGYEIAATLAGVLAGACVVAVNDVMAVGVMAALRDAGLDVPGDVSVAGFDDIATLRDLVPSLTTVHLPLEEMGARAARLAVDSAPDGPPRLLRVKGTVVLRRSTRAV